MPITLNKPSIIKNESCTTCSFYLTCVNPLKKHNFRCDLFSTNSESTTQGLVFSTENGLTDIAPKSPMDILLSVNVVRSKKSMRDDSVTYTAGVNKDDFEDIISDLNTEEDKQAAREKRLEQMDMYDISKVMNDIASASGIVPHDLKLSDSSLPEAKNFYDFCTGEDFLCIKPFLMQILIATELLAEYCPLCSDLEWIRDGRKVNDTYSLLEQKVCFLEYGVCPSCGQTKSNLVNHKYLNYYTEAAIVAGQRCVSYDTMVLTEDGLMEIGEYSQNKPLGFSDFKLKVYNGEYLEETSDYYISENSEYVKHVILETGHNLTCTDDHPILVITPEHLQGIMTKTQDLKVGDWVKLRYDTQVFGNKLTYIRDIVSATEQELNNRHENQQAWRAKQELEFLPNDQLPNKLTQSLCELMGLCVTKGGSCSKDTEILDHVRSALSTIITPESIHEGYRGNQRCGIHIKGIRAGIFLETLMGQELLTGGDDKRIPLSIRQGPNDYHRAFLRGIFEGDGWVKISSTKKMIRYRGVISHCTTSRILHVQISAMLMNLGIVHRLKQKKAVSGKTKYIIEIQDQCFINRYAKLIGFISSSKTAKLQALIGIYGQTVEYIPSVFDKMPVAIRDAVIDLFNISGMSEHLSDYFSRSTLKLISNLFTKSSPLTSEKLKVLVKCLTMYRHHVNSDKLSLLSILNSINNESGVVYTQVKEIKESTSKIRTYDFTLPKTHRFVGNSLVTANSGKSALVAMLACYVSHKMIKLQKPTQVYSLLPNSVLHGTFVALTYSQARDTLWQPMYEYLQSSPWFNEYHKILDDYSRKYGEEFYKLKDSFVFYRHRSFLFYASAPHSKVLRGRTRCFGSIDELGLFDAEAMSSKVRTNATEIHISVERSLLTLRSAASRLLRQGFNDIPTGYFINVSSPFSQYDKIMQLYTKSLTSSKLLGYKIPTWEMNPTITMEDLSEEFANNPLTAWRDYGVSPSISANSFITSHNLIQRCYSTSKSKKNGITLVYQQGRRKDKSEYRYADPLWVRSNLYPSVLAIDCGETVNAYAMVCAHRVDDDIYVDLVAEVLPLPGVPVNHTKIFENLIHPVIERQNVVYVTADRWNSVKLLSDIESEYDIHTKQYSLKYRNFFDIKALMDQGTLYIPKPSLTFEEIQSVGVGEYPGSFMTRPSDHLIFQMLTVRDTGSKVIKGDGDLNDDIFRALVLAVYTLLQPENSELFSKTAESLSTQQTKIGCVRQGTSLRLPGSSSNMTRKMSRTRAIASLPKPRKL